MQKMKLIISAGILIMFICSCGYIKSKKESTLNSPALRVIQIFPDINKEGKVVAYDTERVDIYYYNDQILYNDFYDWTTVWNGAITDREKRQSFFVYTYGNTYGLLYDKYQLENGKRVLVDSMLKVKWYANFGFVPTSKRELSSHYNPDSGILKRLYFFQGKLDTTMKGTSILSFTDKLNKIKFSLSKELDTVPGMKLYESRSVTYGRSFKGYDFKLDTVEQILKLQEISISNTETILDYFNREKNYNKKN